MGQIRHDAHWSTRSLAGQAVNPAHMAPACPPAYLSWLGPGLGRVGKIPKGPESGLGPGEPRDQEGPGSLLWLSSVGGHWKVRS